MKVTEIKNEGLKREFKVVLPAADLQKEVDKKLQSVSKTIKLDGFRPGKAPLSMIKKKHGRNVLGEVLEHTVSNTTQKLLQDKNLYPALQPKIDIAKFEEGSDLEYSIAFEVFPEVPEFDLEKIKIQKPVADISDKDIDDGIERIRKSTSDFVPLKKQRAAKKGDAVLIDFTGKLNGEVFEGGSAKEFRLELGSGQFIPGFEDQLVGVKKGEDCVVKVTFPENYGSADLAGKDAEFEIKVHEVLEAQQPELNDEFAQKVGAENVEKLKGMVKSYLENDFANVARVKLKKDLFDSMDKVCKFDVPEGMVELEYKSLLKSTEVKDESDKDKKKREKECNELAERRVRLGILLSEIGRKNNIAVTENEVRKAVFDQAKTMPGYEKNLIEYYQKNPQALDSLRGPILEDKVVNFIVEKINAKEQKMTTSELIKFQEEQNS